MEKQITEKLAKEVGKTDFGKTVIDTPPAPDCGPGPKIPLSPLLPPDPVDPCPTTPRVPKGTIEKPAPSNPDDICGSVPLKFKDPPIVIEKPIPTPVDPCGTKPLSRK